VGEAGTNSTVPPMPATERCSEAHVPESMTMRPRSGEMRSRLLCEGGASSGCGS
jgi:hypothetical protein